MSKFVLVLRVLAGAAKKVLDLAVGFVQQLNQQPPEANASDLRRWRK
ncbi:MAG: hypothetical protein J2P57_15695 [Acidimicrobiaceae bacterium]|nr:hypothetical protein [Acidimicrobiaceae bacterium]